MDIAVTKLELLDWVLHLSNKATFEKLLALKAETTDDEVIVAYSSLGEPLNVNEYKAKADKGLEDIREGNFMTDNELSDEMNPGNY